MAANLEDDLCSPSHFFREVCWKMVALKAAECSRRGGRYTFRLQGEGGGTWTLDYVDGVVREGPSADSDVEVEMQASDFGQLLAGELDAEQATVEGRIRIAGDVGLLKNVAEIMTFGQSGRVRS